MRLCPRACFRWPVCPPRQVELKLELGVELSGGRRAQGWCSFFPFYFSPLCVCVRPGDVVVCDTKSPSWSLAFCWVFRPTGETKSVVTAPVQSGFCFLFFPDTPINWQLCGPLETVQNPSPKRLVLTNQVQSLALRGYKCCENSTFRKLCALASEFGSSGENKTTNIQTKPSQKKKRKIVQKRENNEIATMATRTAK